MKLRTKEGARLYPALVSLLVLAACSNSSDDEATAPRVRPTSYANSGTTPLRAAGDWAVFLANEATTGPGGTDLNGDGDLLDDVAVTLRTNNQTETLLGVAALEGLIVSSEIYLVVDEAQGPVDWNGMNGLTDTVLLHWSQSSGVVVFVDTLDPLLQNVAALSIDDRLVYASATAPAGPDETGLRFLETSDPTTPVVVLNEAGAGQLAPVLKGERNELILLVADETTEAADLNGDGDMLDPYVLALLDGTDEQARVKCVGLAQATEDAPVDAYSTSNNDWLVGLLVNEAAQGATNLNDQALFANPLVPDSCLGAPDADTLDDVLFYLEYEDFLAGLSMPVNSGLAGTDRVVAVADSVATLAPEGDAGNCDFNEDGDMADTMARWVETVVPIAPPRDPSQLHAVALATTGGSMGLASLEDRVIAVIDEAADSRDLDGKPQDNDLVGWVDPEDGLTATWTFAHQGMNPRFGTGIFASDGTSEPYAGTCWMEPEPLSGRLGIGFEEAVPGTNPLVGQINNFSLDCGAVMKDMDFIDVLPVWADFENGPVMDFDGVGFAVAGDNVGLVVAGNHAYFRVSEMSDNTDYNRDGDLNDLVLMRNILTTCEPQYMAVSSGVSEPIIFTEERRSALLRTSEVFAGEDLNGDGDMADLVVQYFRY